MSIDDRCERCGHSHVEHIYKQGVPCDCGKCRCAWFVGVRALRRWHGAPDYEPGDPCEWCGRAHRSIFDDEACDEQNAWLEEREGEDETSLGGEDGY